MVFRVHICRKICHIDGHPHARELKKKRYQAPFVSHGTIKERKCFGDVAMCSTRLDEAKNCVDSTLNL